MGLLTPILSCDSDDLQFLDMISISTTLPVEAETAATTPFNDENPPLCQVPSTDTVISVLSVAFASSIVRYIRDFATFSAAIPNFFIMMS